MTDEHRNAHRATDQVGEVSPNIQPVLEERLADLKQRLETNPASSNTEAAQPEVYEVRVSNIASEQVSFPFLGCFPKSPAVRYVWGAPRSQQAH